MSGNEIAFWWGVIGLLCCFIGAGLIEIVRISREIRAKDANIAKLDEAIAKHLAAWAEDHAEALKQ